jgi:hypothetical protein
MDFFLASPPPLSLILKELVLEDVGLAKAESSPDLRFICSALPSRKVLNSLGANSGCNRAGTQNRRESSSSLADAEGIFGMTAAFK